MVRVTIHIPKILSFIICINSFIAYYKNDIEISNNHDGMSDSQIGLLD